jgi:DNA-binding NarL/FixJ family response regulator
MLHAPELRPCRVLVVEDDTDARQLVTQLLQDEGHEVRHAGDGVAALETAASFGPDVVILDLRLPVMSGAAFLRQFRAMPAGRAAVLVLSALTGREIPDDVNAFMAKPFIVEDLTAEVARLCAAVMRREPLPEPIDSARQDAGNLSADEEDTPSLIKLMIVEDQRVLADVLALAISDEHDIEVVGVAPNAATALGMAATARPDLVLMDYHLPDGDGVAASRAIHAVRPGMPIIILTGDASDEVLLAALNAGVSGFLVKSDPFAELVPWIRRAAAGEILWPAERLARLLARSEQGSAVQAKPGELTRRERDVLQLMSDGLDNKTIAHRLGISLTTTRGYVQGVLQKLGAHSKLEAVVIASRSGLLRQ